MLPSSKVISLSLYNKFIELKVVVATVLQIFLFSFFFKYLIILYFILSVECDHMK